MKIKEIKNRIIEILTNKNRTYLYLEFDEKYLRKYLVSVLRDKRGSFNIPDEEIDALADTLLPTIVAFFSSEEGRAELEKWQKERELKNENKAS